MKAFDSSSLWRISEFRKARNEGRLDLERGGERPTLLPTTLLADLRRLQSEGADGDILEVIAACVRNHEAALLYLEQGEFVWPVTLFPREGLYHSPRDALEMAASLALSGLRLLIVEPPGVRPPGHSMHERIAGRNKYRPLAGLLWAVALHGPRPVVLERDRRPGRLSARVVARQGVAAFQGRDQLDHPAPRAPVGFARRDRALARNERRTREPAPERAVPLRRADGHAKPPCGATRAGGLARLFR